MQIVPNRSRTIRWIAAAGLAVVCAVGMYLQFDHFVTPVALAESEEVSRRFKIADFLYQIHLTDAYWSGQVDTPYSAAAQGRVLETRFGTDGRLAMAYAMSPVSLVLWYPLAILTRVDAGTAYSLWLTFSFFVFAVGVVCMYGSIASRRRDLRIFFVVSTLAVVASRVGWMTFGIGQNSPVATAGVLLLVAHLGPTQEKVRSGLHGPGVLMLAYLMVTWKLHYLGLAGGLHLILGRPRRAVLFAGGALLIALGIPSVFDPGLFTSFLDQLAHFAGRGLPSEYVEFGSVATGGSGVTMRSFLRGIAPEELANLASWSVFLGAVSLLVALRLKRGFGPGQQGAHELGVLFLGAVLVLLPYLGRYDDLFLLAGVALVVAGGGQLRSHWLAAMSVVALLLACSMPVSGPGLALRGVLVAKVVALAIFWWMTFLKRREGSRDARRLCH